MTEVLDLDQPTNHAAYLLAVVINRNKNDIELNRDQLTRLKANRPIGGLVVDSTLQDELRNRVNYHSTIVVELETVMDMILPDANTTNGSEDAE